MRDEVESPCVKVCVVHPTDRIDEIARWSQMEPAERQEILADLPERAPLLRKRRGGKAARTAL